MFYFESVRKELTYTLYAGLQHIAINTAEVFIKLHNECYILRHLKKKQCTAACDIDVI